MTNFSQFDASKYGSYSELPDDMKTHFSELPGGSFVTTDAQKIYQSMLERYNILEETIRTIQQNISEIDDISILDIKTKDRKRRLYSYLRDLRSQTNGYFLNNGTYSIDNAVRNELYELGMHEHFDFELKNASYSKQITISCRALIKKIINQNLLEMGNGQIYKKIVLLALSGITSAGLYVKFMELKGLEVLNSSENINASGLVGIVWYLAYEILNAKSQSLSWSEKKEILRKSDMSNDQK